MSCRLMILAVLLSFLAGCATAPAPSLLGGFSAASIPEEPARPRARELPDDVQDLQRIPQNIQLFARKIKDPLTADEQKEAQARFRERYFSPWLDPVTPRAIEDAVKGMRETADRTWFGENRRKVEPETISLLLAQAALDRLPSLDLPGIATEPTYLRGLPTSKPLYETPDDFPFDQLQYTEIKPNEPLRVLHISSNGAWLFIKTSCCYGWARTASVRLADESLRRHVTDSPQVVVTADFPTIRDEQGRALPQPKLGTLYPLRGEEQDNWIVEAAGAVDSDQAVLKTARLPRNSARPHPLPFTMENVAAIGGELLKTPYGWGELYRDRDCSATTRDFFLPFGMWLPRNSKQQVAAGTFQSLKGLSSIDKEKVIKEQGRPFRTLLHRPGHIMLYAGTFQGIPVVLHNAWAVRFKTRERREEKFYIGRTVLTTLEVGEELALSRGSILDNLEGMSFLPR